MIRPLLKFSYHSIIVFIEIVVALFLLFLALMCFGFWKLSSGPVDITFAADTIKKAIISSDHKTDLQFDSIVAEWREFSGPISIGLSGVKLVEQGKPVLSIPQLGIRIAKTPLLIGMVKPEAVIAKDATVKLLRTKNGGLHFLLGDSVPVPTPKPNSDTQTIGVKDIGEALFKGGNLPDYQQIQPLSQMERFSVENAHLIIVDEETGRGWNIPQLDFEVLRKPHEFTVVAHYQESHSEPSNFSFLLERNPFDKSIRFFSEIDKVNASVLARLFLPVMPTRGPQFILASKVEGILDEDWAVKTLKGDISSNEGVFHLDGLIDSPLKFSNLKGHLTYDKASNKIVLRDTRIDINGRTLDVSGEKLAGQDNHIFKLNVKIPDMSFDDIQTLWPKESRDSLAADWLTRRLSKGQVSDLSVIVPVDLTHPDIVDTTKLEGSFSYKNLMNDYRSPMMPVTNAAGRATFKDDTLIIYVDSGKLGDMDIQKAVLQLTHLTHHTVIGEATIDADVSGSIGTALEYIAREPISLGEKVGINPTAVRGTAQLNVKVNFPLLKDLPKEDVMVKVTAKLDDVFLPKMVRGMDITGGPFDLNVDAGAVTIKGKGALADHPLTFEYMQAINLSTTKLLSTVKADVIADKALREKFGVKLDSFVEGSVPVTIDYRELKGGEEQIDVKARLTPAVLKFSPFKYRKREGKSGEATCHVLIQKGQVQKISDLKITVDKEGSALGNIAFGRVGNDWDVKSAKFSQFTLAGANNFALDFAQTAPDVFDITIQGKQLDGRPFLGNKNDAATSSSVSVQSGGTRVNAVVKVAQIKTGDKPYNMLMAPDLSLRTTAKGDISYLDLKGGFSGGVLSVSIKPDANGKSQLRINSDNAGAALKVLDIYDTMIGGTMDIRGSQITGGGINDIAGRATIANFTVVKAPVLAKLINLFSLSGLTELLQNKGIAFQSLKTNFAWKDSSAGRVIALQKGRTTGASIGLTFEGTINQDKGKMDVSGTFVPMSEINGFVNKIPLIGGLLTGGKNGGVIAATYSIKGDTDDPTTLLNPLSVLTPGFLRSILFENGGSNDVFESEDAPTKKAPVKRGLND